MASPQTPTRRMTDWIADRVIRSILWLLLQLPYRWRVPFTGWLMSRVVAPLIGYRRRIRDNLALIVPDLPESRVREIVLGVPDNLGHTIIEMYSGAEFTTRAARSPFTGPGLAAIEAAVKDKRPVILVTGHIGNYDAARAALNARGLGIGGLYKPMTNRFFNTHYVRAMERIGKPMFPRGRAGLTDMIRFLRGGGTLGIVLDQHVWDGVPIEFMGRPAMTSLSAAELALRYGALLVPAYGLRADNGLDFDFVFEAPVPEDTPEAMTRALNQSLERHVYAHMEQWLWTHRRWKTAVENDAGDDD